MKEVKSWQIALITAAALAIGTLSGCDLFAKPEPVDEIPDPFYQAENWQYMTNGSVNDGGGTPYSLCDGSIRFHNANSAYDYGKDLSNDSLSFQLNGSKDWQMWFLASSKDNTNNDCYQLVCKDSVLYFTTPELPGLTPMASVSAKDAGYTVNAWNTLSVAFSTTDDVCTATLTVNGKKADLTSNNSLDRATVEDGNFTHRQDENFKTGNYVCVKVWYGDCFLQLKPLGKEKEAPTKIACLGDSITYGAAADNSYTDSYPAQLQKLLGEEYSVMNFGKSGATLQDSADDPYRRTPEYAGATLFVPDIAIIMLGTNDSKTYQKPVQKNMEQAYDVLIADLLALNEDMEIIIATSPYAYNASWSISNSNIENTVIPAQENTADKYGLQLIPMHEYTKKMSGNFADGIHPSSKGYTYIAYRMYCDFLNEPVDEEYVLSFKDSK